MKTYKERDDTMTNAEVAALIEAIKVIQKHTTPEELEKALDDIQDLLLKK